MGTHPISNVYFLHLRDLHFLPPNMVFAPAALAPVATGAPAATVVLPGGVVGGLDPNPSHDIDGQPNPPLIFLILRHEPAFFILRLHFVLRGI